MNPFEIIVIILAVLIVAGVIAHAIYKKVTGQPTDCGYGCSSCHNCPRAAKGKDACNSEKRENNKQS